MTARKSFNIMAAVALVACTGGAAIRARSQSPQAAAAAQTPNVFEDDRIRVSIPEGWTLSKPTETVTTLAGTSETETVPGAVLTNGKYKLYLLTHHDQASGTPGGRFGEISDYLSPWLDTDSTCASYINPVTAKVDDKLSRVDNYYDTAHPTEQFTDADRPKNCGAPSEPVVFWYGSYFQQTCSAAQRATEEPDCGGYFLYYADLAGKHLDQPDASPEMTFSLAYDTTDPTASPRRGDAMRICRRCSMKPAPS